jgi:hypothetical protein
MRAVLPLVTVFALISATPGTAQVWVPEILTSFFRKF